MCLCISCVWLMATCWGLFLAKQCIQHVARRGGLLTESRETQNGEGKEGSLSVHAQDKNNVCVGVWV